MAEKIKRFTLKIGKYCAQNASFLEYTTITKAAAIILVSINLTGAFRVQKSPRQAPEFDPLILWDKHVEQILDLSYERDIQELYLTLYERIKR